ncbi:MAG: NADH-quinone oxidoreductase subunit C [Deltaproteobacteria bacterium]|nr:NADH-quinone oxidoreductase subunit C [Deltaproteobacteria bacterium]
MTEEKELLVVRNLQRFGSSIVETSVSMGEVTCVVKKDSILDVCRAVKADPALRLNFLMDVAGVDRHPRKPRFEVVYHLLSLTNRLRLRLKVRADDGEKVPSVVSVWGSADWPEREAFDMFGIVFENHPGLRRIYMPHDWEGFPLRKDYPLKGYKDQYNPSGEEKKK